VSYPLSNSILLVTIICLLLFFLCCSSCIYHMRWWIKLIIAKRASYSRYMNNLRPHHMQTIATDDPVAWCVCQSSLSQVSAPCKNVWTDRRPSRLVTKPKGEWEECWLFLGLIRIHQMAPRYRIRCGHRHMTTATFYLRASPDYWWWSGVKEGTLTQLL